MRSIISIPLLGNEAGIIAIIRDERRQDRAERRGSRTLAAFTKSGDVPAITNALMWLVRFGMEQKADLDHLRLITDQPPAGFGDRETMDALPLA